MSYIVNKLRPKSSHGEDVIYTELLNKSIDKMLNPITYIFETGIFQTDLKCAKVSNP